MKEFDSLKKFSIHLKRLIAEYPVVEAKTGEFIGVLLEKEAKDKIGHLQQAAGPFKEWAPLAESTKLDKEKKGYVFNADYNPLYRQGDLKDSIHHVYSITRHEVILGSTSQIMIYQELGTNRIPPRSVIGATMFQAKNEMAFILGEMLTQWISGKSLRLRRLHGSI